MDKKDYLSIIQEKNIIHICKEKLKDKEIIYRNSLGFNLKNLINKEINTITDKITYKIKDNTIPNKLNKKRKYFVTKIIYKINSKNVIKLFGEDFVILNRNKCRIELNHKKYKLIPIIRFKKKLNLKIKIKLIIFEKMVFMNSMFEGCQNLLTLKDLNNLDVSHVIYMNSLFAGCSSLISLPDISEWKTHNVRDMNFMFMDCSSLKILPDISK